MTKTYLGDTGTAIILDTGQNLTGTTSVSIQVQKPNSTVSVTWPGSVVETTKVRYITLASSLDVVGDWKLQAKVEMPSGTWLGETVKLTIYRPFN